VPAWVPGRWPAKAPPGPQATIITPPPQVVCASFGREALVELVAGVQAECDVHGSRLLQRYLEARLLARLVKEIGGAKRGGQCCCCCCYTGLDLRSAAPTAGRPAPLAARASPAAAPPTFTACPLYPLSPQAPPARWTTARWRATSASCWTSAAAARSTASS
jgi:hypothetical protein